MSELAKALVAVQSRVLSVNKDGKGYGYNYATLGNVIESIAPLLADNGLAIMQPLDNINGEPALRTIIMHTSGERVESVFPLEKAGMKGVNDAQQIGAAITYMRRYGICAAFNLITEDDDAACLSKKPAAPAPTPSGSLEDRAKAIPSPQAAEAKLPPGIKRILDAMDTMDAITAKCKELKPLAIKEGWDKPMARYWQERNDQFKELEREVFGE